MAIAGFSSASAAYDSSGKTDAYSNPRRAETPDTLLISEEGTHIVTVSRPKMWYDDGGPAGKMAKKISYTYTFLPAEEGYAVTLNATAFAMGSGRMKVYSGRSAEQGKELGSVTGYGATTGPKNLVSKADDGALTVVTTTPAYSSLDGFAIELGLHQRVPFALEAVESKKATTDSETVRGASDANLLMVKATVSGDKDASEIGGLKFDLTGTDNLADVTALKLYCSGSSATFSSSTAQLIGSIVPESSSVSFPDASVATADNGDFYLWLVADLNAEATPGNKIATRLTGISFNGTPFDLQQQTAAEIALRAGLSGIYTVGGASADYADFAAMTDALKLGIEGPTTMKIADGTYAANIAIKNVAGTSALHPLTITSQSGNPDAVTISGKYSYSDKTAILSISGTPYVTVSDLTLDAGSQGFENVAYVTDASRHTTFSNLTVKAAEVTSGSSGINLVRTYTTTAAEGDGRNNDFFTIRDSRLYGGFIGLYLASNGIVARVQDKGYTAIGNIIENTYSKAIYLVDLADPLVEGNSINVSTPKKGGYFLDAYRLNGGTISANRIVVGSSSNQSDAYLIYLRQGCQGTAEKPIKIVNNEAILQGSPNYNGHALTITNDCKYVDVDHNTFRASGVATYLFATASSGTPQGIRLRNNIFHSDCTADASYPLSFWNQTDKAGYSFAGNIFYSPNGHLAKNDKEIVEKTDIATLLGNENNAWEEAKFLSAVDSHLSEPLNAAAAQPVENVVSDRDGISRSTTAPTPGAYEYAAISQEAPQIQDGYPSVGSITPSSAAVRSKWSLGGNLYAIAKEWSVGAQQPAQEEILNSTPTALTAMTDNIRSFTNLKAQTSYRVFMIAESAVGAKSEIVSSEVFTTTREITPLEVVFADDIVKAQADGKATLEALVDGGDAPYSYEWKNQMNSVVGNEATLDVELSTPQIFTLSVASSDGQKASAKVAVEITGIPSVEASFDDNYLPANSSALPQGEGFFYSGTYKFNYDGWPDYDFWYGFNLSSETSNQYTGLNDQFRSAAGGAYEGSNFAIAYPEGLTIEVTNDAEGDVIPGCYVCNTAYALNSMTVGDGFASPMKQGGWFLLKARAFKADGTSTDHDVAYLADYRSANADERYMVNDWKYVDLSGLGKVKKVTFLFDGSDKGSYGLNTPAYVALDNFGAKKEKPTVGLESVGISADVKLYPSPVTERLFVETGLENYNIDIISTTGALIHRSLNHSGFTTIERDAWTPGIYLVRIYTDSASTVKRIIVK